MLGQLGDMILLFALVEAYRGQRVEPVLRPGFLEVAHSGARAQAGGGTRFQSNGAELELELELGWADLIRL